VRQGGGGFVEERRMNQFAMTGRVFYVRPGYKFKCVLDALWPIAALVAIAVIYFAIIRPSRGQMVEFDFKYKQFIPLIVAFLVAWLIWDGYKIQRAFRFRVALLDEGIRVGGKWTAWSEIAAAEVLPAYDWAPAAILHRRDEETLHIPAALDGADHLCEVIRRRFPDSAEK
jgi:hypothetical protein